VISFTPKRTGWYGLINVEYTEPLGRNFLVVGRAR